MRLFVAVRPSAEAVADLREHLQDVRPDAVDKWHVTLVFLGEVPSADSLRDRLLGAARLHEPFHLRLSGSGTFGPRATWVGVDGDVASLRSLAADVQDACRNAGVHLDSRAFRPHLTVGRLDPRRIASYEGPDWRVPEIELVHSVLGRRAVHTVLETFPLANS